MPTCALTAWQRASALMSGCNVTVLESEIVDGYTAAIRLWLHARKSALLGTVALAPIMDAYARAQEAQRKSKTGLAATVAAASLCVASYRTSLRVATLERFLEIGDGT